eukprot:9932152-Alexandrium_andersonii.AAC.1
MEALAAAVTAHHAAMWRLATRALEAFDVPMPGLERPPTGARRDDRPAAFGGCSDWQPCSTHVVPLPARLERPPLWARRDDRQTLAG